jgi:hypothetical protein
MASCLLWRIIGFWDLIHLSILLGGGYKFSDGCREDIAAGFEDGIFEPEKIVEVAFELLQTAGLFLLLLGTMLFTIAKEPECVAFYQ